MAWKESEEDKRAKEKALEVRDADIKTYKNLADKLQKQIDDKKNGK